MRSVPFEAQKKGGNLKYSSSPQSPFSSFQTPYDGSIGINEKEATPSSSSFSRISPLILLVIIVLAVIFFIYGLIHLILWFLMKRPSSSFSLYNSNDRYPEATHSRALQRQLQHLFRLHDSGLDQSLIDALPVFYYEDLLGLKEPFDCAVCLCEFSDQDKLRLIPICSHAFHIHCLDTWLLSNSTCPLCRAALSNSVFPMENPIFNLENSWVLQNRFRVSGDEEINGCSDNQKAVTAEDQIEGKRLFSVRLGKFRNNGLKCGVEDNSNCGLDVRRCYSMGSYQYVVGDSNLQVVLSESHDDDRDGEEGVENGNVDGKRIRDRTRGESFSVSKIWLWSNKSKFQFHTSSNAPFP